MTDPDPRPSARAARRPLALPSRRPRLPRLPARVASRVPESVQPALDALPGLARIAASTALHTAEWGMVTSVRTGGRLARALVDPQAATDLADELNEAATMLGALARAVAMVVPLPAAVQQLRVPEPRGGGPVPDDAGGRDRSEERLRAQGQRLLQQSRDVWSEERGHPAFERILGDLAPDEARILVLLLKDGPQPAVDVRTGGPVGMVNSQLVARGLNMVGARAGLRYVEMVPQYLNNLTRLGLVWQSSEALDDLLRYQVVEAQPDVLEAMHAVRFARVLRRSLHLTPFGLDFARACFADGSEDVAAFPAHEAPPDTVAPEPTVRR